MNFGVIKYYLIGVPAAIGLVAGIFFLGGLFRDTDADGLSDFAEIYIHKTNPESADTDGDLLKDGFEVAGGLNPLTTDDLNGDPDSDGLTNLQEAIYDTNPSRSDSDNDGVNDGVEVEQGSSANNASDGGKKPAGDTIVNIRVAVGDPSGSESERYNLNIGGLSHQAPQFGRVAEADYKFKKGKRFQVTLVHTGTRPDYLEAAGAPNYDWYAGLTPLASPPGFYYIASIGQPILGTHYFAPEPSLPFPALESAAELIVPLIDVDIDLNKDNRINKKDEDLEEQGEILLLNPKSRKRTGRERRGVLNPLLPADLDEGAVYLEQLGAGKLRVSFSNPQTGESSVLLEKNKTRSDDLHELLTDAKRDILIEPVIRGPVQLRLIYVRQGAEVASDSFSAFVSDSNACARAMDRNRESFTISTRSSSQDNKLAIGDKVIFQLKSDCTLIGLQTQASLLVGEHKTNIPLYLINDETGERATSLTQGFSHGPYYYHSDELDIVHNNLLNGSTTITASYGDDDVRIEFEGIRHFAVFSILNNLISEAKTAPNFIDTNFILVQLVAYLTAFDEPEFYDFAISTLVAARAEATFPEIIQLYIEYLMNDSNSSLNRQLLTSLDASVKDMISESWWDDNDLKNKQARRALVLLKRVALAHAVNRITELNKIKEGSGVVGGRTYLSYSPQEAMRRLGRMKDDDKVAGFLNTNGVANNMAFVDELYGKASVYVAQKSRQLEAQWTTVQKLREDFLWAQRQSDLVFDWTKARTERAQNYLRAEAQYKSLLSEYQILLTEIENDDGDDVPAWKAVLEARTRQEKHRYIAKAVSTAEQHMVGLVEELVEMRRLDHLVALGGSKYHYLHQFVAASDAPMASSLLDYAKGLYRQKNDEAVYENLLAENGVWIAYGIGVFFPPAAFAAGVVDVTRSGGDAMYAYRESASADTAANAGLGSVLEADKASLRFTDALGQIALDSMFAYGDIKGLMSIRKYRWRNPPRNFKNRTIEAMSSSKGMKKLAEADAAYFAAIRRQRQLSEDWAMKANAKRTRATQLESEIADLKVRQFQPEYKRLQGLQAEAKRLQVFHEEKLQKKMAEIEKLKARHQNRPVADYEAKLKGLEDAAAKRQAKINKRRAEAEGFTQDLERTPEQRLQDERARLQDEMRETERIREGHMARRQSNLSNIDELRRNRFHQGRDRVYTTHAAQEGTYVQDLVDQKLDRVFDLSQMMPNGATRSGNPFYSNMYRFKEGHYMFGPRVPGATVKVTVNGRTVNKPRLQYEIRTNGTITDPQGNIMKPPKEVNIPGQGIVKTGYTDRSQRMEFDRIVIDHKNKTIYVEDLVRSENKRHLKKTWAYAASLEKMFPGYNATNIPIRNNKKWPRDIVYSDMSDLAANLNPDTQQFPALAASTE